MTGPLFCVVGMGFLWLAYLCATERLKRNGVVGMRTTATMASDPAWYAAHRASAWSIALAGAVLLAVGLWLSLTSPGQDETRTAVKATSLVVIVVIVIGGLQAHRVARDTPD